MGRGIPSVKAEFTHYREDWQIKGFHLNVNQKGNKSIIVIWKRTALFAFRVVSLTLFLLLALAPQIGLSKSFCGNKLQTDVTQSWDDAFIWLSYFNKHPHRWIRLVLISCGPTAPSFKVSIWVDPLVGPTTRLNDIFVSFRFIQLPVWNICTLSSGKAAHLLLSLLISL